MKPEFSPAAQDAYKLFAALLVVAGISTLLLSPAPPQAQGHCRRHSQAGERLDHGLPSAEEAARGIRRMIAVTMAFLRTRPRQRVMSVAISPTSGAPTSIVRAPRG